MIRHHRSSILVAIATVLASGVTAAPLPAQPAATETYSATATVKGARGPLAAPVVVVIVRHTTEAERGQAVEALKAGGTSGLRQALERLPPIGYIDVGGRQSPIKYAFARAAGSGRLLTVISDRPIAYLGEQGADAKPKAGYDLAFALLNLPGAGKGSGELGPAVKVKLDAGAVVTEDYGAEVVMLTNVEKKP